MSAARAELLTRLGQALGCNDNCTPAKFKGGLPESCYYAGAIADLGPAPEMRPRLMIAQPLSAMDREAAELRRRGDEGLLRFFQKIALRRRRRVSASPF